MRIKLDRYYTGVKSGMKTILPGEYEDNELPGGLAVYLVETDHATDITPERTARKTKSRKTNAPTDTQEVAVVDSGDDEAQPVAIEVVDEEV